MNQAPTASISEMLREFRAFGSTPDLMRSTVYRRRAEVVSEILGGLRCYERDPSRNGRAERAARPFLRAVAWNIERGLMLDGVREVLSAHAALKQADVYFLTELDVGMARSGNRDVPREIAERLGLNGVFAPCYLNIDKGSGLERFAEAENAEGLHGNGLFSPWPIRDAFGIDLPNGRDKMTGRERRLGHQRAVGAVVDTPHGSVRCVSIHLDARSSQGHRRRQMRIILDALPDDGLPVLLGGDWNTSTHNTSRVIWSIIGFWLRVAVGVKYCLDNHYPYPERLLERRLFKSLESAGFDYRSLNALGVCTLRHRIMIEKDRENLRDWVPDWCIACIRWALRPFDGVCPLKLDWFAGRGVRAATPGTGDASNGRMVPSVIHEPACNGAALSDHDAIVLDFVPAIA